MDKLLASFDKNEANISPSAMYKLACVTDRVPFFKNTLGTPLFLVHI
jgi:myo-inositol-1-phosphate synthase